MLVVDTGAGKDGSWSQGLSNLLASRTDLRALVILSSTDPALETTARKAGARAILVRPFAIRDFVEAVDSVGGAPPS